VGSLKSTTGSEIKNEALATKLKENQLAFTKQEWDEFKVSDARDLYNDCYIEAGGTYFQPAGKEIRNDNLLQWWMDWSNNIFTVNMNQATSANSEPSFGPPTESAFTLPDKFTLTLKEWDDFGLKDTNVHDFFRAGDGTYWKLTSKPNKCLAAGKVRGAVVSSLLNGATKYDTSGTLKRLRMTMLAMQRTPAELIRDEKELQYVLDEVQKLKEGGFTSETCRDSVSTWVAFLALYKKIKAECALGIIECIASDVDVMKALGAAAPLLGIDGNMPPALLPPLNLGPGVHIREHAYAYTQRLDKELTVIKTLKEYQARIIAIMGAAITAAFISFGNFVATYAYDTYKAGKSLPLSLIILVLVSIFGCCFLFCACTWFARRSERPSRSGYNLA